MVKSLVFVLWATGVAPANLGADKSPAAYWHPMGLFKTEKGCHEFAANQPRGYARRMICLRSSIEKALRAQPQQAQPR